MPIWGIPLLGLMPPPTLTLAQMLPAHLLGGERGFPLDLSTPFLTEPAENGAFQVVAERMGLDTKTTTSLWKDKAAVEVNVAVLHSYQVKMGKGCG